MTVATNLARRTLGASLGLVALLLAVAPAGAAPPGFVEWAPPNPDQFRGYLNIVDGKDGFLYFTQAVHQGAIGRLAPNSGAFQEYPVPTPGRPNGLTRGPNRTIWFTNTDAAQVGRLDLATGVITEYPLTAASFGIQSQPRPITLGPDGNLWFVQIGPQIANVTFPAFIGRMTQAGEHKEYPVPTDNAFNIEEGITVGPDNRIWFTESNVDKVGRLDPATGAVVEFDLGPAGAPLSITSGPDGFLWVGTNNGLARVSTTGDVTHIPLPQAQGNDEVFGITTGADGHVWFTLGFALGLGRINPATLQAELYPIGSFQLDRFPYGITAGPDGNIWYADLNANRIGQASFLSILPARGTFIETEAIDVVVVNHAAGRVATGGQMRLNGAPVTDAYLDCLLAGPGFGTLPNGGQTFRCGAVPLSLALLGPGVHRVDVDLTLDAGPPLQQTVIWEVLPSAEPGPGPGPVVGPPALIVAPPPGQLIATQRVDFVVAVTGGGLDIVSGTVLLDGTDVTAGLVACPSSPTGVIIPGSLLDGGVTYRCPRIPAALLVPGPHLLDVEVVLDDGTVLRRTVEYIAVLNTEP